MAQPMAVTMARATLARIRVEARIHKPHEGIAEVALATAAAKLEADAAWRRGQTR